MKLIPLTVLLGSALSVHLHAQVNQPKVPSKLLQLFTQNTSLDHVAASCKSHENKILIFKHSANNTKAFSSLFPGAKDSKSSFKFDKFGFLGFDFIRINDALKKSMGQSDDFVRCATGDTTPVERWTPGESLAHLHERTLDSQWAPAITKLAPAGTLIAYFNEPINNKSTFRTDGLHVAIILSWTFSQDPEGRLVPDGVTVVDQNFIGKMLDLSFNGLEIKFGQNLFSQNPIIGGGISRHYIKWDDLGLLGAKNYRIINLNTAKTN